MKKLLLLCSAVFALQFVGQSQVITDTLTYFLKKQRYKEPLPPSSTVHPTFKSSAGTVINTQFTHVGSIFGNRSTVVVNGLEAMAKRPVLVVSDNGKVPTRLYLANVVNGLPVFPLLDSTALLTTDTYLPQGQIVGGPLLHGPKVVNGSFAVLIRCVSLQEGDTIEVFRTNGHHINSTTAPTPGHKFGEGLGVVRYQSQFWPTTNFNHPYFGSGTDYEFCVAPRVTYTLDVSQNENPIQYGVCCWQAFTNTNTSHSAWTSPQFNFTEFNTHLKPFNANFPGVPNDSALVWFMGDGSPCVTPMPGTDIVPLCACGGQCNQIHYDGVVRGNFKKIHPDNPSTVHTASISFMSSMVWCNDTAGTGFNELGPLANVKIYPNPVVDKTTISGLKGNNTIQVYNMIGQLILTQRTQLEEVQIDLSKEATGNYMIRISDAENNSRGVKIIKQ